MFTYTVNIENSFVLMRMKQRVSGLIRFLNLGRNKRG